MPMQNVAETLLFSQSHRGFGPVVEVCQIFSNRFNGLECAELD